MKTWTQKDVDSVKPDNYGVRHFPANTIFGKGCSFGEWCSFGECCRFGEGCSFGEWCKLEKTKPLIGSTVYSFGGFGSSNRTTYFIPMKSGIYVRCGCWAGSIKEFRTRVSEVYEDNDIAQEYLAICDVATMRWKRELKDGE